MNENNVDWMTLLTAIGILAIWLIGALVLIGRI